MTIPLDLATKVTCGQNDGELPTLIIDTSHTRIVITPVAASLPHLATTAELAEAADMFHARLHALVERRHPS